MTDRIELPTAEDRALAETVAAWMESLAASPQPNDYMENLATYGRLGVVNAKGMGIVASAISAFNRDLARKAERANALPSTHVGAVGERLHIRVTVLSYAEGSNDYGLTTRYKFSDANGNLFTWFGTRTLRDEETRRQIEPGETIWVQGSVKEHAQWNGVLETHITRVQMTEAPEVLAAKAAAAKAEKAAAAKAQRAARKAFGKPQVRAVWEQNFGGIMRDVQRVVQYAATEFGLESNKYDYRTGETSGWKLDKFVGLRATEAEATNCVSPYTTRKPIL